MKRTFKKIRYVLLIFLLLVVNFSIPEKQSAEAKTLRDLKQELATYQSELEESNNKKRA